MLSKIIYDYEEFEEKISDIISNSKFNKFKIKEIKNNWMTECNIRIKHYAVGEGKEHIVIFGAFHGSEIISAEFLLYVMNEIIEHEEEFREILEKYILDFIPIVNPEGYIITTSVIRKLISRDIGIKELEKICKNYYLAYKQDDINENELKKQGLKPDHISIKNYQKIFKNVTWKDIPDRYDRIKKKLENLYNKYNIPDGAIVHWTANANGIDINANTIYNKNLAKIEQGQILYMTSRNSNIKYSEPGPINCLFDSSKGFVEELENKYISDFLEELNSKNELIAILNYHSAGGLIDQRPSEIPQNLKHKNINLKCKSLNNYLFSKFYQSETFKDLDDKEKTKYKILKDSSEVYTLNGLYRVIYPLDILIELSGMGGNPIGPYGDIEKNYANTMNSNLKAMKKCITYLKMSNEISNYVYNWMEKNIEEMKNEKFINLGYQILDEIFLNIDINNMKKETMIEELEHIMNKYIYKKTV